jgi:hypothetical protein
VVHVSRIFNVKAIIQQRVFHRSVFFHKCRQDGHSPGQFSHLTSQDFQDKINRFQRLARFLDRPLFPWKKLIVGFSLAQYVFEGFLSLRQYQVLKQTRPPKVLQNEVSQEVFDKSQVPQPYVYHRKDADHE